MKGIKTFVKVTEVTSGNSITMDFDSRAHAKRWATHTNEGTADHHLRADILPPQTHS